MIAARAYVRAPIPPRERNNVNADAMINVGWRVGGLVKLEKTPSGGSSAAIWSDSILCNDNECINSESRNPRVQFSHEL